MIDKLILTGGQNVDPKFYGEPKPSIAMTTTFKGYLWAGPHQREAVKQKNQFFCLSWNSTL